MIKKKIAVETEGLDVMVLCDAKWLGFIVPGGAEQVQRVQIPKTNFFQAVLDIGWHQRGVSLLRQSRDNDLTFPYTLQGAFEAVLHDGQIDFCHV